jgi:hypothetical protein
MATGGLLADRLVASRKELLTLCKCSMTRCFIHACALTVRHPDQGHSGCRAKFYCCVQLPTDTQTGRLE